MPYEASQNLKQTKQQYFTMQAMPKPKNNAHIKSKEKKSGKRGLMDLDFERARRVLATSSERTKLLMKYTEIIYHQKKL